jgi:hypothetical protein
MESPATPELFLIGNQFLDLRHSVGKEATMAFSKPVGDNACKGAVKKRTQLKNALTKTEIKRDKKGG